MPGRVTAGVLLLFLFGFFVIAAGQRATAATTTATEIAVVGNRHIDAAMIRAHFRAGAGGRLDADALDAAFKSLYATGLFADVKISRQGERILVTVKENPTIARLAFEGNRKIKDADLKKAVQSREGGPLARALVHDDVEHIIELYRQRGFFTVRVDPKTIKSKNERVNLVFEISEGDRLAVGQILFSGNEAFTATKLKGVISTGESNVLSFLTDNDTYDADRIERDRDLIGRFYLSHGYADARVHSAARYDAEQKGVVLTFTIEEGPQYRVGRVALESRLNTVQATTLRRFLRMQPGEIFDVDAVQKTVADAAIGLAKDGAPFASVIARTERLPERRLINIVYTIEQGSRAYIERVDIHGNTRTRDDVIRREFDFVEGDALNHALIERAERRLRALRYFKSVKIATQPGSAPDRVVVNVTVEEQQTGNFSMMGGYSHADGASGTVTIADTNVLGTGDTAKLSATIGQYARGFDLSLTDPYALGPRLSLGAELFGKETLASSYQSFDSTVYGAKISAGMPITEELSASWIYSIYNQGLSLVPSAGTASLPIQQAAAAGPIWVSSVGSGLTYSTLDNAKNPSNGIRVQTNDEFAGLGGAAKFARTTEDARYYHEIGGDVVGMMRAQGGYVTPWGGQPLPLLNGFFGGPQLVRGFAPNGFGPRDVTPGTTQDNVGGNVYWTTSAELQTPMPLVSADAQLKVALFADAGSLWATHASSVATLASSLSPSQQIANSQAVRASLGASLIWDSPFGALRVDYAYPVAKQSYDVTQRLNFTASGF
ncbi:MAG TPA: outer membrane protein assembly factor BamA [Xanthobacteraceae bacterium]|nr:outer membrane protein assembly factor BamA [Xanthobacteraceae bacterium]